MSDIFTTDAEKASYGIGLQMGEQLKANPFEGLNLNSVFEGMKDAYAGSDFQVEIPAIQAAFEKITQNVVEEVVRRNDDLPPTEAIKITTMAGCSAVKK